MVTKEQKAAVEQIKKRLFNLTKYPWLESVSDDMATWVVRDLVRQAERRARVELNIELHVDGCVKPRIFGEQADAMVAVVVKETIQGGVGLWPELGLSLIDCIVVAVELVGVVVFEDVCEFVEELEQFRRGLVGEVERKVDKRRGVLVHGHPVLAVMQRGGDVAAHGGFA